MVQQSYSLCLTSSVFCPPTWTDQLLNQGFWGYIISSGEGAKNHRRPTNHWDAQWYKPQVVPQGDHHRQAKARPQSNRGASHCQVLTPTAGGGAKKLAIFGSRDGIVMGRWWKTGSIPFGSAGGFVKLRIAPDVATANERDFPFTETYAGFFVFGLRMHIHTYVYEHVYKCKCL